MTGVLRGSESDIGGAPRASSNVRHLCRMELAGGPKERGYFIPKPGDGVAAPLTNDVFKDRRGLLWVTDKERGLDVIEYKN